MTPGRLRQTASLCQTLLLRAELFVYKTIVFLRVVVFDTIDVVLNVHSERHSI